MDRFILLLSSLFWVSCVREFYLVDSSLPKDEVVVICAPADAGMLGSAVTLLSIDGDARRFGTSFKVHLSPEEHHVKAGYVINHEMNRPLLARSDIVTFDLFAEPGHMYTFRLTRSDLVKIKFSLIDITNEEERCDY